MTLPRTLLLATLTLAAAAGCANTSLDDASPDGRPFVQPKKTIVLVHGAWGGAWAFREADRLLTNDGWKVYRPTLTGQGERVHLSSPDIDLSTHIQDVVNEILYEDLHNVVLVGHSYGGMVITGVADRIPDRIKQLIYVDACLPNDGESLNDVLPKNPFPKVTNGYILPTWLKPNTPPPHDVPMPAKCFSEKISLKNPARDKIPATYILTVDAGKQPKDDTFYTCYQRAQSRGWPTKIMTGPHNVQWTEPRVLVKYLEQAAAHPEPAAGQR
ncbi:MAG TPA: alpha/beta fold hydrolase [Phycisphaerae bacterium]|nr:alpha/beta fold hydrolase [Phycisphaerae bacterium]